jgi:two-component system, NtrC family, nitrogen regulation sensor histidine kinase NtrY
LPSGTIALWFVSTSGLAEWSRYILTGIIVIVPVIFQVLLRRQISRPLQTLSNLLAGLREGDYSINARGGGGDAMGLVLTEANSLVATMREQRLGAREATALLLTVMTEIDVAVFTFDRERKLRLVNRSGERLLNKPMERLLGSGADALELAPFLKGEETRTVQQTFPGGAGRWRISHSTIREKGQPHDLLVISDLSRELREEERVAWQRLVRVFGHELNNSLAPIKSIAGSLCSLLNQDPPPEDLHDDLASGLNVVASRAESLDRFLGNYARLAKLPKPQKKAVKISDLIDRVVRLETRLNVSVHSVGNAILEVDGDQLEQVLINLVRNAVDAVEEEDDPLVSIEGRSVGGAFELRISDNGPGLANTANLFVPFFTTKPKGTGIGLALSRQIIDLHDGSLTLVNRSDGKGCVATIRLLVGQA